MCKAALLAGADGALGRHLQQRAAPIAVDFEPEALNCTWCHVADDAANGRSALEVHDDFTVSFAGDFVSNDETVCRPFQFGHLTAKVKLCG